MKYQLFIYTIILIILFPFNTFGMEKWSVHEIYNESHWKIISYKHHSNGYSVKLKQIKIYQFTSVNNKHKKSKMSYTFGDEYLYQIKKSHKNYPLMHEFFSKFGINESIQPFPSEFISKLDQIDPYFENHIREMLGYNKLQLSDTEDKSDKEKWNYTPKPKYLYSIWTIQRIEKYPSCYRIDWNNKSKGNRSVYLFKYSEEYFLLEKLLNQVNRNHLIKYYWNDESTPTRHLFENFTLNKIGVNPVNSKPTWMRKTIFQKLPRNHELKKEYTQQFYKAYPNIKYTRKYLSQLTVIKVSKTHIIFWFIHRGKQEGQTYNYYYGRHVKGSDNILQFIQNLQTYKFGIILEPNIYGMNPADEFVKYISR